MSASIFTVLIRMLDAASSGAGFVTRIFPCASSVLESSFTVLVGILDAASSGAGWVFLNTALCGFCTSITPIFYGTGGAEKKLISGKIGFIGGFCAGAFSSAGKVV